MIKRCAMRLRYGCAVALMVALAGCGTVHSKDLDDPSKPATTRLAASQVVSHYNRVRVHVDSQVDASALVDIEGGSLLEIDMSTVQLGRKLDLTTAPVRLGTPSDIFVGQFDAYPLWFVVVAPLKKQVERVAAVFVRSTSTSPWLMTEAPRLARETPFPSLAVDGEGFVVTYDDTDSRWSDGETASRQATPQRLVGRYAELLGHPDSPFRDDFVEDSFLSQMWELSAAQPSRKVEFTQQWRPSQVKHVVRLSDGGALVFATLTRTDLYRVRDGSALDFEGLDPAAYLPTPVTSEAKLTYKHQVLLLIPRDGKPLVIGQHGGLVDATGF